MKKIDYLNKQQLKNVIDGISSANRIPCAAQFWISSKKDDKKTNQICQQYPSDVDFCLMNMPEISNFGDTSKNYVWVKSDEKNEDNFAIDSKIVIKNFEEIDDILSNFPSPDAEEMFSKDMVFDKDKYLLGHWWFFYFERHWSLRGMENALTDFYLYPEEVHKLYKKLTKFYKAAILRTKQTFNIDGIFVSDDLGTQNSTFFSKEIFLEFFYPYYKEIIDYCHSLNIHFWLHTCGNIEEFIPYFIDLHIDVLHPLQRYSCNIDRILQKYGGKITFWIGFDVQQVIPWGTPEKVKEELRYLIKQCNQTNGKLILGMGNFVNEICPELFEAYFEELFKEKKEN